MRTTKGHTEPEKESGEDKDRRQDISENSHDEYPLKNSAASGTEQISRTAGEVKLDEKNVGL